MSKTTVFILNVTLKAGKVLHLKGTKFTEETLPPDFKVEVLNNTGTIEVFSYGEDFEDSSFDPAQTATLTVPKAKLGRVKKKLKASKD